MEGLNETNKTMIHNKPALKKKEIQMLFLYEPKRRTYDSLTELKEEIEAANRKIIHMDEREIHIEGPDTSLFYKYRLCNGSPLSFYVERKEDDSE